MEDDIVGMITAPVNPPHKWNVSDPILAGSLVQVSTRQSGTVVMKLEDECCDLCQEMDKVSITIQKKIIALLRLAGSNIKVDWEA